MKPSCIIATKRITPSTFKRNCLSIVLFRAGLVAGASNDQDSSQAFASQDYETTPIRRQNIDLRSQNTSGSLASVSFHGYPSKISLGRLEPWFYGGRVSMAVRRKPCALCSIRATSCTKEHLLHDSYSSQGRRSAQLARIMPQICSACGLRGPHAS